jgi:hypothetical protein
MSLESQNIFITVLLSGATYFSVPISNRDFGKPVDFSCVLLAFVQSRDAISPAFDLKRRIPLQVRSFIRSLIQGRLRKICDWRCKCTESLI